MVYLRRLYFTKKMQLAVFALLVVFTISYVVFQLSSTEKAADIDFARQDLEIISAFKKQKVARTNEIQTIIGNSDVKTQPITKSVSSRQSIGKLHSINTKTARESIAEYIDNTLQESLKEDKGTGCEIPKLDPFSPEVVQFDKVMPKIHCSKKDWVQCYSTTCRVDPNLLLEANNEIECSYRDILYESDKKYSLGPPTLLKGDQEYKLRKSDHVIIKCRVTSSHIFSRIFGKTSWVGVGIGYRPLEPPKPPVGREDSLNVLIFGFDSTSKNAFIRKMPKSYKFLKKQLGAIVLNGYNIVGDGTPAALFPILTGKTEIELPECRKTIKNSGNLDDMPFIFYSLKKDGYRTAYYEDMPWIGTFQYRFNGFRHQPSDHYLRAFYLEELKLHSSWAESSDKYCVGGTPRYQVMMNITDQFFKLDGKKYAFTFIADITHDDFNMISVADDAFVEFLQGLLDDGVLRHTLFMVMGDHGSRYANVRGTLQGKFEERLPLMAIRLPEDLISRRPDTKLNLEKNVETLTTPHDIYATVLDAIDLRQYWNSYKVPGADLTRGMTLFEPVPKNRSCSEAGIEPHWCSCLKWETIQQDDPMFSRTAQALVDHINKITESQRSKCAIRTLTSVDWVTKKLANKKMLEFQGAKDSDGYVGKFGKPMKVAKDVYQVKITVGPGNGAYEAAVTHLLKEDKFNINTREISRINAYDKEPECISDKYPHLNMYCYCKPVNSLFSTFY